MPSSVSPATRDVVVHAEEPVFVQLVAALQRPVAQLDVVRLRAGEVLHRRAAALGSHAAQVGLIAAAQLHARLGVALAEHALDARMGRRTRPSRASVVRRRCERMSMSPHVSQPAAQAADRDELGRRRRAPAGGCTSSSHTAAVSASRWRPASLLPILDGLEDLRLFLRAHARHRADAGPARRGGEAVEAGDAQRRVAAAPRSWAPRPAGRSRSSMVGGNSSSSAW